MPIRKLILLALLGIIFITVWWIRYKSVRYTYKPGDQIRVTGQVSQVPAVVDNRQKVTVGTVKIYLDRFPEYRYGERIVAEGKVEEGKAGWFLKEAKVEKVGGVGQIGEVREKILAAYKKTLPEPHAALLSGIVLGTKSSLENSFFESLRTTGTLHVVVASGTNIALFSGLLINVTAFIWGRKRAVLLCFVLVWAYVLLIGADPPIVRAAIMGSILIFAQSLGREFEVWRALVIAGSIMLFIYPLWLFDLGFQLSFLATTGIVGLGKRIERLVDKVKYLPAVFKSALSVTLAAQAAVTPLLFITFGQVFLISPLVNTLVLWSVPFIMLGGFMLGILGLPAGQAGFLGIFGTVLGQILAWFLWLPLEYFVRIVTLFGQ